MTRIPRYIKPKAQPLKPNKIIKKINPVSENFIKSSKLEKSPLKDYFYDYSTETKGYFTKRESKTGKLIEVFPLMFPR